jgi:hypothetical protein
MFEGNALEEKSHRSKRTTLTAWQRDINPESNAGQDKVSNRIDHALSLQIPARGGSHRYGLGGLEVMCSLFAADMR